MAEAQPDFRLAKSYMLDETYFATARLNYQFLLWKDLFGFNIHPSIKVSENAHVADIATGTAIWAVQVAREHPTMKIDAVDLSLSKVPYKGWLPDTISFREWNMFHEVPEDMVGKYDLIHVRLLVLVIENEDPRSVLRNLKKMLKPNGYLQWDDLNFLDSVVKCLDPALQTPALDKFRDLCLSGGKFNWTTRLHEFAKEAGFGSAELYNYEDRKDMTIPEVECYLSTINEFAERLQGENLQEEATHIKNLCQEAYLETRKGGAVFFPKLICVATSTADLTKNTPKTKESLWWRTEIGPRLKPAVENAYLKWTGMSSDTFRTHLYKARSRAWEIAPYPCVGQWMFMMPGISVFSQYPSILSRAKNGAKILDMACCFGQELRLLASAGVPTENMYASDLFRELWDLGYDLFNDREKMKAQFIQGDIFNDNSELHQFNGKMDIIIANQFIHLFDYDKQIITMKKVIAFTSGPGAVIIGYQRGREKSKQKTMSWGEMFVHDLSTWQEIWALVGKETGTKWNVDAVLVELKEWGMEKEDSAWMDQYPMGLNFVVTRLE